MTSAIETMREIGGRVAVRCGLARVVRRFRKDETGATAVEFGLVAVPFFALMFAILETAIAFFAQQLLEETLSRTARLVRTGQAQQGGYTAASFKTKICDQLTYMFNCTSGLTVDVKTFPNFAAIDMGIPLDANGNLDTNNRNYSPGKGGDIVLVRAYYSWPVFVNRLGNNLVNMPNGTHLLVASVAFRNEPFPW
jgi:Flp pilus assembly protein TadG